MGADLPLWMDIRLRLLIWLGTAQKVFAETDGDVPEASVSREGISLKARVQTSIVFSPKKTSYYMHSRAWSGKCSETEVLPKTVILRSQSARYKHLSSNEFITRNRPLVKIHIAERPLPETASLQI